MFLHSFHVEHVDKEYVAAEAKDPDVVYQEEQQEFEVDNQVAEPVPVSDFANPDSQQGKHRCILTQCRTSIKSFLYDMCIKSIGVVLIPSCMM